MRTSTFLRKAFKPAAIAAAVGVALPLLTSSPAGADPKQFSALIVMGSDTTQSIMDALAGESNGILFSPIKSSAASGSRQLASWTAAAPGIPNPIDCITPKAPGATVVRPVGSTNGRRALSRAINGEKWGGPNCGTSDAQGKAVSGLIDVARSSSNPSGTGTALQYLPFGRDALTFAYYRSSGSPVTSLTKAQLFSLFTTGPQVIGGVEIVPCGIQTGSGTYGSWNTTIGMTAAQEAVGTATCNAAGNGVRVEEHDSDGLKAKGDSAALLGKQVIVGMGAGPFISQWNGVAVDRTDAGVDLGSISDDGNANNLGKPYTGTIGTIPANLAPVAAFYNNATFGRTMWNVIDSAIIDGPVNANQDIKTLLVGPTSAICSPAAQAIVNTFGFLTPTACGDTAVRGPLVSGNLPTS